MNTKLYTNFIKTTLENEGIEVATKANKLALEMKQITLDQYIKASRILAKYYIDR